MTAAAKAPKAPKIREGSERLLDAAGIPVERMPMLNVILDRTVEQCSENVRHFSATPAIFAVRSVKSERFGDILDTHAENVVVGIFQAWDTRIIIGADHRLVFTMVEALFGGDASEPPLLDVRALSTVELNVAQILFEQTAKALQAAFSTFVETSFKFERTETRMDFANILPRSSFAVMASIQLRIFDREGEMFIAIPQSGLAAIRQSLSRDVSGDTAARDPRWSRQIRGEVSRTKVDVRAVIEERQFCLEDIAALEVGQILKLQATARSRIKLESNDHALFWCQLGQAEGRYTIRIEEAIDQEQEFLDDILTR
jgi:flagellar motor switch protein FliM